MRLCCFSSMRKLDVAYRILPCRRAAQYSHSHALMLRHVAESTLSINKCTGCMKTASQPELLRRDLRLHTVSIRPVTVHAPGEHGCYSRGGLVVTVFTAGDGFSFQHRRTKGINHKQSANSLSLPANWSKSSHKKTPNNPPLWINMRLCSLAISINQHFCKCTRFAPEEAIWPRLPELKRIKCLWREF